MEEVETWGPARAARNADWIERHCIVPEGKHVGKPFRLHQTQRDIIDDIYGTPTRTVIISMGRKNGKTTFVACLLLLHLVGPEARRNCQAYSTALSREQAAIIYKLAAKIVRLSPTLVDFVNPTDSAKRLTCADLGTEYRALSADAHTAHGHSPVLIIHDELGQVVGPESTLYDTMETAVGAHDEPLSIVISTQARDDIALLSGLIDDAKTGADPKTKLFLWAADKDDDPWSEETWKKANPLYGVALQPERVRELAEQAQRMPAREAAFRNLVLNQRVAVNDAFISRTAWEDCQGHPDHDVFRTGPLYLGLDLSARNDLTALAWSARDGSGLWHVACEFFTPQRGLADRAKRDRVPYEIWARDGLISTTPGGSVDYEFVAMRLIEICDAYDVTAIAFDRWRIDVLAKELSRLGAELPLHPFGQGFKDMSPALDTVESALLDGKIRHGGHPVLTWCAANAIAVADPAGNRKLDKRKSTGRIDGIVAVTMAIGVAQAQPAPQPKRVSVYAQGVI